MGSFARLPWPMDVRVTSDARVLEIDLEDLFDVMEEHFDLVRAAIAELSREREELQGFAHRMEGTAGRFTRA
jgi:CRP-like cAMP-binding protein